MTMFYEGPNGWDRPAAGGCQPGMVELRKHLVEVFGGRDLGCYNNRPKSGGASPSLHRDGRAIDIGFLNLERRDQAFRWLVDNATALRVQMVLNYRSGTSGGYRWRLKYNPSDTGDGMGPWNGNGHWLHVERTKAGAADPRPIAELVAPAPTRRVDMLDISQYQTITKWADVPPVPIVHRVVTKEGTVDPMLVSRLPVMAERSEVFGGYAVLVGGQTAAQMATYVNSVRTVWRPGAFTQLDLEPWPGLPTVTVDDVTTAADIHDRAFGSGRWCIYLNPSVLPGLWADVVARWPQVVRWVPGYRDGDDAKAARYGAAIHQWSDSFRLSGFTGPADVNEVRDWAAVRRVAGLDQPPLPPDEGDDMILIQPVNAAFKGGVFTPDGHPVSPEALKVFAEVYGDKLKIVKQNHPHWDAATLERLGSHARELYRVG